MPVIDIDTSRVKSEGQKLGQVANEFNNSINSIYDAKDRLGSGWKGTDAEKYKAKLEEFREPLNNLKKALTAYSEFITESAAAYDKQQENISSSI